MITIATLSLPDGVELRFPRTVPFNDPDDATDTWATLTLTGDNADNVVVGENVADNTDDGSMVTYAYSIDDAAESMGCDGFLQNPHNGRHRRHCFGSRRHRRYLGHPGSAACR